MINGRPSRRPAPHPTDGTLQLQRFNTRPVRE